MVAYLASEYVFAHGGAAVISIQLAPYAETQVLCQLRNDWVVVVDFLDGRILKLHTFIKGVKHYTVLPWSVGQLTDNL